MRANLERRLAHLESAASELESRARAIITEEDLLSLGPDELLNFSSGL